MSKNAGAVKLILQENLRRNSKYAIFRGMKVSKRLWMIFVLVMHLLWVPTLAKDTFFSPMIGYDEDVGTIYGGFFSAYIQRLDSWHQVGIQISEAGHVSSYSVEKMPISSLWELSASMFYSNWKDPYYGLGNQTDIDNKVMIDNRKWLADIDFKRELSVNVSWLLSIYAVSRKENGALNDQIYFADAQLSGLGTGLEWDSRNQVVNTQFGTYAKAKVIRIATFNKWDLDLRHFWSMNDRTIASRLSIGHIQGDNVPYVLQYKLGSKGLFLGSSVNRYNGQSQVVWQQEYRQAFWRFIDIIGFYEFGQVASSPKLNDLHSGYGVGFLFRFKNSEQGLRFNMGRSGADSRVSVTFNHTF